MDKRIGRKEARAPMRVCRGALTLAVLCLALYALMLPSQLWAQTYGNWGAYGNVRPEEKIPVWIVDENGSWRAPLPNWTLEEVMRFADMESEPESPPPWSIQSLDASGSMSDGIARLRIEIEMNVADGIVRAPLGLSEGVYIPSLEDEESGAARRGGFSYEGPGLCVLDVDRKTGEYIAIFQTTEANRSLGEKSSDDAAPGATDPDEVATPEESSVETSDDNADEETEESVSSENPVETDADADSSSADEPEGSTSAESAAEPTEVSATLEPSETNEHVAQEIASSESGRFRPNFYRLTLDLSFTVDTPGQSLAEARSARGATDDSEHFFYATFPPSLHSQLTLVIPTADVELFAVEGAAADSPITMSESTSELKLRGLGRGGERVEFGWRRDLRRLQDSREEERVVYQVEDALIVAELDARGTMYDATIPIRAFGGESDVFYVDLPMDATLTPDSVAAIGANGNPYGVVSARVVEEEPSDDHGREEPRKSVEIRLAQKTSSLTLRLKALALASSADSGDGGAPNDRTAPRHLGGFSVRDAQKQFGQMRILKSQDYDFNVTPSYGVSSALENPIEDGAEVYTFFSQPFLMTAEGYRRETVVGVRPEYLMTVGSDELRLRARFAYSVYGSKIREMRLRLNGWILSQVYDSEDTINQEGIVPSNDRGETVFPLATPSDGEFQLELEFVRDVSSESPDVVETDPRVVERRECSVSLPIPLSARVEPASVVILPENAIEITPRDDEIVGLTRKTSRPFSLNLELPPDARQNPIFYQTRLGGASESDPLFVADIKRLEQDVRVKVRTEATISEQGVFHVNETLEYRIEREPLDTFEFEASAPFLASLQNRGVKCFVDGRQQELIFDQPTAPSTTAATTDEEDGESEEKREDQPTAGKTSSCRVVVDSPRIGDCVVTFQYDLNPIAAGENYTNWIRVYLIQPHSSMKTLSSVSNELTLSAPVGLGLRYSQPTRTSRRTSAGDDVADFQTSWESGKRVFSNDGKSELVHCASTTPEFSALFSASRDSRRSSATIVDRAWIQSWFSGTSRVDRVVWKMQCDRDHIEIRLPDGCRPDQVAVSVDGDRLPVGGDARRSLLFRSNNNTARIPIDPQRQRKEVVIEVDYVVADTTGASGRQTVEFPNFVIDSVWIRRVYWQTIFNRNQLMVVDPHDWTTEFIARRGVGFGALFYRRVPTMTQDELCDWIGINRRVPIPQEANVYLYSRFFQSTSSASDDSTSTTTPPTVQTLPNALFYVANNAFLVFFGSGITLALGLALIYLRAMTARQAALTRWTLLVLCGIALITASLRPLLALLFLQTTTIGALLTLVAVALSSWFGRGARRVSPKESSESG